MKAILIVAAGLLALSPATAKAAAACVGKVANVYVESDMNLHFGIEPTGVCGCNRTYMGAKTFVADTQANKKEQYAALLTAHVSGSTVQIWYDWADATGNASCKSANVALIR